jgi:alpha-methylacyl-CoA racemase
MTTSGRGPLASVRVVEMAGLGPTPFGAMVLADLGADVIRVDRARGAVHIARLDATSGNVAVGEAVDMRTELLNRGRRSIGIDIKTPEGIALVHALVDRADVFIEGYRPGVMERLGLGPEVLLEANQRLVYARMSGYGQGGPLRDVVGHDLNYLAQTGVLSMLGRRDQPPTVPPAVVGDFGGGGMSLALGVVAGVLEARVTGVGQVVDVSIAEGAALVATAFFGFAQNGEWRDRGTNIGDGGAPFYDVYETSDGGWLSVAAVEPHFYDELLDVLGVDGGELPAQFDVTGWPTLRERFAAAVGRESREHWRQAARGRNACLNVVLSPAEAMSDPDNLARGIFVEHGGVVQPGPTPRFSRTPGRLDLPPPLPGEHSKDILDDWQIDAALRQRCWDAGACL